MGVWRWEDVEGQYMYSDIIVILHVKMKITIIDTINFANTKISWWSIFHNHHKFEEKLLLKMSLTYLDQAFLYYILLFQ